MSQPHGLALDQIDKNSGINLEELIQFDTNGASSNQVTGDSFPIRNTRKRVMTEKGLDYTIVTKRKIALTKVKECVVKLKDFRYYLSSSRSQDDIKNARMEQIDATFQSFDEWSKLVVDPIELCRITDSQDELKTAWENALEFAQERLRILGAEDTKSTSSCATQKSIHSRGSTRSSSTNSKDGLINIKAKKAVLQEKLKFTDMIKEQEKTLAKLKLEQEQSQ